MLKLLDLPAVGFIWPIFISCIEYNIILNNPNYVYQESQLGFFFYLTALQDESKVQVLFPELGKSEMTLQI